MTDRASLHGTIDVTIMTQAELEAAQQDDDDNDEDENDQPLKELRLVAPGRQGLRPDQRFIGLSERTRRGRGGSQIGHLRLRNRCPR